MNDTKPYGNILDFRGQEKDVDEAIALFSGKENSSRAKEIWLVDPAPVVVEKLDIAVANLEKFMESQGLECKPEQVSNLKGDAARGEFINKFKEVQRLKTQLDQYTDIKEEQAAKIEELLPEDTLRAFRGVYIETAQMLKAQQGKDIRDKDPVIEQLDFEFEGKVKTDIFNNDLMKNFSTVFNKLGIDKKYLTTKNRIWKMAKLEHKKPNPFLHILMMNYLMGSTKEFLFDETISIVSNIPLCLLSISNRGLRRVRGSFLACCNDGTRKYNS